ncbi:kinase-like domain-containing protein [Suillus fuscotomentosus]|uniref:non-specific serine/threonine protein kinase n=1 Tax=Suillus fuscotomentosus TaxID=1912939 RepID=A0AAD4EM43_9AGAM|nr:kinase-like domain-containing protein [Suillus fuscotomentosus]KAG1907534.1 kinase-like domain-containing protein [Suillus fuscotomentosus]
MKNVPIRVDGRFRLGDMLGSGSYGVVYHAWNIINDDEFAVKLEPLINNSSSLEHKYNTLKQLQGGVGIPRAGWFGREVTYDALVLDLLGPSLHDIFLMRNRKFNLCTILNIGDQLLSSLEHIHSHNYVYGDIKPQNVLIGRGASKNSIFIVDFGVAKEYWSSTTQAHMSFHQVFASINNHLGVVPGHCDDLELLVYMLIYFICGSLPWLTSDHEKLSSSSILACKVDTTIEVLCLGIPSEITTMLIYSRNLAFSEDPDYTYLRSLLHDEAPSYFIYKSTIQGPSTNMPLKFLVCCMSRDQGTAQGLVQAAQQTTASSTLLTTSGRKMRMTY